MTNTITSKTAINALNAADVFGADQASNNGVTAKVYAEQIRHYDHIGSSIISQKFQAKLAAMKTGTGNVRVFCLGDSTTVGKGSTAGADKWGNSWPALLTKYLIKNGVNATNAGFFCNGDGTNASAYNPRLVVGNVWSGADDTIGGSLQTASANTNPIAYTPTEQWDTAKVWYATIPSSGTLSLDVDGSGTVTQSTTGASGMSSKTITTTLGIHTLNIKWSSGGAVYIMGAELWNSTINQVQVINCGWGGLKTGTLVENTNPYNPLGALQTLAPDLTIFGTVINDWGNTVNLTTFKANVQTLITTAQISGDAIWLISVPTANAQVPITTQLPYVTAIRDICNANSVPVIDIYARYQTYEISQPLGLYSDNVHPAGPGYEIMGKAAFDMLNTGSVTNIISGALVQSSVIANSGSAYTIDQANGAQFDITLNAATPVLTLQTITASKTQTLAVTLIQDGTGSRVPSWANVTWAAGIAPTISSAISSRTYLAFVGDGTTWTGYAVPLSTGTGAQVLANAPTFTAGIATTPVSSHTATTAFGSSLTLGTALQNTTGYDLFVNIVLSVTVAASATVVMGVGSTSTPTTDTAISTFSITGDFTLCAYVPNNYYLLVNKTGTLTSSNNIIAMGI